jgi:hypothetical protein
LKAKYCSRPEVVARRNKNPVFTENIMREPNQTLLRLDADPQVTDFNVA